MRETRADTVTGKARFVEQFADPDVSVCVSGAESCNHPTAYCYVAAATVAGYEDVWPSYGWHPLFFFLESNDLVTPAHADVSTPTVGLGTVLTATGHTKLRVVVVAVKPLIWEAGGRRAGAGG
jgi:hypothetical protein